MAGVDADSIEVVGANANNLRDVDVNFPSGAVSMVVGVSGSGKSSLLTDTIAREGNLRLHTFLGIRQEHLDPPASSAFIGRMPPTLHVGQRAFRASSRTTVGTSSGLLSLLRRMFIRWSSPVSARTGEPVPAPTVDSYKAWLLEHHRGGVVIWATPLSFVANDGVVMAERLLKLGLKTVIVRSESDSRKRWEIGRTIALDKFKPLAGGTRHLVESEVGNVNLAKRTKAVEQQLEALLALAFEAGEGRVFVELVGASEPALDSRRHWVSPNDTQRYRPPSEHLLSFNAPEHEASGACPECCGLGRSTTLNIDALVVAPEHSMHEGAFALWTAKNYKHVNIQHETIEGLRGLRGFDPDRPWSKLSTDARQLIIEGAGNELITDLERGSRCKMSKPRRFEGFRAAILNRIAKRGAARERLAFLVGEGPCPSCQGTRWSLPARALSLGGYTIDTLLASSFADLVECCAPDSQLSQALPADAAPYIAQLYRLAESFVGVGLDHVSGDRGMLEISEGESRRLRLAATLDGRHSGLCLLFDEPARGLHDEDVDRLAGTLTALRGTHTLILNEHRRRLAAAADFFVELGPGAGPDGGKIVHAGKVPKAWWRAAAAFERKPVSVQPRGPKLRITGAQVHNLEGVDVAIPLGHLVCLVGVSGSGKSSFVRGVLVPALVQAFNTSLVSLEFDVRRGRWKAASGTEQLTGLVALDQRSPAPNRRSTVATFLGLAEPLRKYYAKLPGAVAAGLSASDFGLNAGEGRCEECTGIGELEEAGHWVTCPSCGGTRFGTAVLAILDNGVDIAQVLERSIANLCSEPLGVFDGTMPLLRTIDELGVGHLSLGRRLDTISGGELQRLRIARELSERERERLMFVLDEPAAGLHRDDVARLLQSLNRIVSDGHSVLVVEHNLDLVAAADWVIEFGPGSGPQGGQLIAEGTPDQVQQQDTPTGRMLRVALTPAKLERRDIRSTSDQIPTLREADSALRWLRRLLGDDVPPQDHELDKEGSKLAIVVDKTMFSDRSVLEYGGLDRELATLMLECRRSELSPGGLTALVDAWEGHPEAELRIHPLVREIYVWGSNIAMSARRARQEQMVKQGFEWFEHAELAEVRAGGGPLVCCQKADRAMRANLADSALLLGGGYVELRQGANILATLARRPLDLKRGLVGPMSASAYDFDRHSSRGRCPCCKGRGLVVAYDSKLVFGDPRKPAEESSFLTSGALSVLKSVHRNILLPFLRRMAKEELWKAGRPISKLGDYERHLLLYGFWVRPGPGSFLRTPKSNPKEVSNWLRWDGLFAHLRENALRGPQQWRDHLLASQHLNGCPVCSGLGLRRHVPLFEFAGRGYNDWLAIGTVSELHQALKNLIPPNARSERRRDRLLEILEPLVTGKLGISRLRASLVDSAWPTLVPAIAAAFNDIPILVQDSHE